MTISTVAQTGSTNADMLLMAADGAAEGDWLRAERQTQGRGRLSRAWESPAGNLHCSTLVRLAPSDPPAATLALVAAVVTHEALSAFAPGRLTIKWPNDIMAGPAKIAGMLLERAGDAVVIGIGANVTGSPGGLDRPVTSLWELGAVSADAQALVEAIATGMQAWLARWRAEGVAAIRTAWIARAHPVGTPLSVALPDGARIDGVYDGIAPEGALILRLANGESRAIHAGDAFQL